MKNLKYVFMIMSILILGMVIVNAEVVKFLDKETISVTALVPETKTIKIKEVLNRINFLKKQLKNSQDELDIKQNILVQTNSIMNGTL